MTIIFQLLKFLKQTLRCPGTGGRYIPWNIIQVYFNFTCTGLIKNVQGKICTFLIV